MGQFPEWNKFLDNAASTKIELDDVVALQSITKVIAQELRSKPEIVDAEVPKTISYLAEMLDNPSALGRRAAFALLRSIENMISRIFTYGADFAEKTATKTVDGASTATSKLIVVGLLSLALSGAASITPIASKIPEMAWIQTASEIVKKQLEKMLAQ